MKAHADLSYAEIVRRSPRQSHPPQSRQVEFNANPRSGGRSSAGQAGAVMVGVVAERANPLNPQDPRIPAGGSSDDSAEGRRLFTTIPRRSSRRAAADIDGAREPMPLSAAQKKSKSGSPVFPSSPKNVGSKKPVARSVGRKFETMTQEAEPSLEFAEATSAPVPSFGPTQVPSVSFPSVGLLVNDTEMLPQQRFVLRGHQSIGEPMEQAILEAMSSRHLVSNWTFPSDLPTSISRMSKLLLKIAKSLDPDEDLCLQKPFTPNAMMASSHFGTSQAFVGAARAALKSKKRLLCLEGDLLLAAIASLQFSVRVMIFASYSPATPISKLMYDFHPGESVVDQRCILLFYHSSTRSFNWAHPASTTLPNASGSFGEIMSVCVASLPEVIEDWIDDANTNMAQVGHSTLWRPAEPTYGHATTFFDGPRPGEDSTLEEEQVAQLQEEHPGVASALIRAALLLTRNDRGSCNPVRANKILVDLCSLQKPQSPALNVNAAMGCTGALQERGSAPLSTGKHRSNNQQKRKTRRRAEPVDVDASVNVANNLDSNLERLATKRRRSPPLMSPQASGGDQDNANLAILQQQACTGCTSLDGQQLPSQPPISASASSTISPEAEATQEQRVNSQPYRFSLAGEQLQELEAATAAIIQITGASYDDARTSLLHHLRSTNLIEEAAEAACADLRSPATEHHADGVSFVERLLGRGVRPATIKEMAQANTTAVGVQPQKAAATHLSRMWDEQLAAESLTHAHGTRARLAHRHLSNSLHDDAIKMATKANQESGCFNTPSSAGSPRRAHPNSAVRMAAEHEARAASMSRGTPVVVISNNHAKPLLWKLGAEKDSKGFCWSTKLAVQQAWEASNRVNGEHAYTSFKSMIHHSMIPIICFELGLQEGQWELISDSELLCRIDAVLKPRDSTEFFLKLNTLKVDSSKSEQLGVRYRAFAEPFIEVLAEASASGMAVNPAQAKAAFRAGCNGNCLLRHWLSEQEWSSVAAMHQRVMKGIRQLEADAVLRGMDNSDQSFSSRYEPQPVRSSSNDGSDFRASSQGNKRPQRPWQPPSHRQEPEIQPDTQHQKIQHRQFQGQQQQPFYAPAASSAFINQVSPTIAQGALIKHPGLDHRGEHWHVPSALLGCRTTPCARVFCQVCGAHDHSAEECKRRRHAQANLSGYFCDNRPGTPRLQFDGYPPAPSGGHPYPPQQQQQQQQPSKPVQHQFAPPPKHLTNTTPPSQVHSVHDGGAVASSHTAQRRFSRFTPVTNRSRAGLINQSSQSDGNNQQSPSRQGQQ